MLDYEEFKREIRKNLIVKMGPKYSDCKIKEMPVNKCGKIKDGFGVYRKKKSTSLVMPTLYYDDLYKEYCVNGELDGIIVSVAYAMSQGLKQGKEIYNKVNIKKKKPEMVVFQLVNKNDYKSLLKDVPHREFLDLAIIYRWAISIDDHGLSSSVIDYDLCNHFGLTEEDLFDIAMRTMKEHFPPRIHNSDEMLYSISLSEGASEEEAREIVDSFPDSNKLFFISNNCYRLGASVLLFNEVFDKLSNELGSDLYIFAVSSSEVIVIPSYYDGDVISLQEQFVDGFIASNDEEFLTNNVYYYDSEKSKFSVLEKTC